VNKPEAPQGPAWDKSGANFKSPTKLGLEQVRCSPCTYLPCNINDHLYVCHGQPNASPVNEIQEKQLHSLFVEVFLKEET
jgi:hypothetical protein